MTRIRLAVGSAFLGLPVLLAAASSIGTVVADGKFSVNQMQVPGSATLFEGSLVESQKSPVTIQITGGPRIDLAAGSSGRVYRDRMVLDTGVARAKMGLGYRIETRDLVLQPDREASTALIKIATGGASVSVPQGQMRVSNSTGMLLAHLNTGLAVDYSRGEQDNASQPSRVQLTGKLENVNGHYVLQDTSTQVKWELVGKVPTSEAGKTVTVSGVVLQDHPVAGADQMARIDTVKKALGGFPCFGGGGAPGSEHIQLTGPMEKNGDHYLLTDQVSKVVSELTGAVPNYPSGTVVTVKGTLVKNAKPFGNALQVIDVDHSKQGAGALLTGCQKAWIAGVAITAGAGIAAGFALSQDSPTPVSQ